MQTWLASDFHFGHTNILKYQPERRSILGLPEWATIEDHDAALIERWNSVVAPGDFVWVLGDVAMGKRTITVPMTALLNGQKAIIAPGNHDTGLWPDHTKPEKRAAQRELWHAAGWSISPEGWLGDVWDIAGQKVTYAHLPLAGTPDHGDEVRYEKMMLPDRGQFHVHGHSHGQNGRFHGRNGRQLDVGLDANELLPTPWSEVVGWVESFS